MLLGAVVSGLVTRFTSLPGLAGVSVRAPGVLTDRDAAQMVLVGEDGDPDSDTAASYEHEPASLDGSSVYERGTVPCCALSQTGDSDAAALQGHLDAVEAFVGLCTAGLRSEPTLAGAVMNAHVTAGGTAQLISNVRGTAAVVPFTVEYFAQVQV